MFFKYMRRNVQKNRKSHGLFFGSLIIAIISFYTLLSLGEQDVIRFLWTFESDAVKKLLNLVPFIYAVSLFFVFFLVYFAYSYQIESRKSEFGLYLMLGMRRTTLFWMLISETIINSIISIVIGLPISFLLTELISLITAKIIGFGIIGHKINFSLFALIGTVGGFFLVQIIAMMILSLGITLKEPKTLLDSTAAQKQKNTKQGNAYLYLLAGIIFLTGSYYTGVIKFKTNFLLLIPIVMNGFLGTFLIFRGIGVLIGRYLVVKNPSKTGLFTFTGRQIQEHVVHQYKSLAIASLLLFIALSAISFGIGIALSNVVIGDRSVDYSIYGDSSVIEDLLESDEAKTLVNYYYPVNVGTMNTNTFNLNGEIISEVEDPIDFSWHEFAVELSSAIRPNQEYFLGDFNDKTGPYLISLSTYNQILKTLGKDSIELANNQVILYTSARERREYIDSLNIALSKKTSILLDGTKYELMPELQYQRIFADDDLSLVNGLIVSDENYKNWTKKDEPYSWNLVLKKDKVDSLGYIKISEYIDNILDGNDLFYSNTLRGTSRRVFYAVTAGYLTLYLGALFMVIANTVIGIKYLIQQRMDKHRYITLLKLGATVEELEKSTKLQIRVFFIIAIALAICNTLFGVWSMFVSFLRLPFGTPIKPIIIFIILTALSFIIIESIYIYLVERASEREIRELEMIKRGVIVE